MLTIWWCPCVAASCVLGRGYLLWPVHSLGKNLLAFAWLHSVLQGQICLLTSGVSWLPTFAFLSHSMKRTSLLGVNSTRSYRSSQNRSTSALQHHWLGQRHGLLWYWMISLGNEQRSFSCFWHCILDFFVDYDGYSIFSKGFLPMVVDIMVIWVKFTLPVHFSDS